MFHQHITSSRCDLPVRFSAHALRLISRKHLLFLQSRHDLVASPHGSTWIGGLRQLDLSCHSTSVIYSNCPHSITMKMPCNYIDRYDKANGEKWFESSSLFFSLNSHLTRASFFPSSKSTARMQQSERDS